MASTAQSSENNTLNQTDMVLMVPNLMLMDVSAEGARGLQEGKGRAAKEDVFPFGVFPQIQLLSSSQSPHSLSLSLSCFHSFFQIGGTG